MASFTLADLEAMYEQSELSTLAVITDPNVPEFELKVRGIFDETNHPATLYETNVDAIETTFEAIATKLATVRAGMKITFPELEPHEDGYGKTYSVVRRPSGGVQATELYLQLS